MEHECAVVFNDGGASVRCLGLDDNAPLFSGLLFRHAYPYSTSLVVVFSGTTDMCPLVALISGG